MAISGTSGYVIVDGVAITADRWTADLNQAAVNRANFTTLGEPLNAAGQRTGEITIEGPYENFPTSPVRGNVLVFKLGVTAAVFALVSARVKKYRLTNNANDGPRWTIVAEQYGAATLTAV